MVNFLGLTEKMSDAFLRKIGQFYDLDELLPEAFQALCIDPQEFKPATYFARQDGSYSGIFLIENGWVVRSKTLENGSRQIVNVALAGDFVGLNALLFKNSEFDLIAKTNIEGHRFDPDRLFQLFMRFPGLAAALFWVNAAEESVLAERIVSLGRRAARQRTAHILCELVARLEIIGSHHATEMVIPISQEDFSDILGISLVHMNRTLRSLENDGILIFRNEMLTIRNAEMLRHIAGFEDGYLHFTTRNDRVSRRLIDPAP